MEASLKGTYITSKNQTRECKAGEFKDDSFLFLETNTYYFSLKHPNNFYIYNSEVYKIEAIRKVFGQYHMYSYQIETNYINFNQNRFEIRSASSIRFEGELQE